MRRKSVILSSLGLIAHRLLTLLFTKPLKRMVPGVGVEPT
jgi:hypothetical protein